MLHILTQRCEMYGSIAGMHFNSIHYTKFEDRRNRDSYIIFGQKSKYFMWELFCGSPTNHEKKTSKNTSLKTKVASSKDPRFFALSKLQDTAMTIKPHKAMSSNHHHNKPHTSNHNRRDAAKECCLQKGHVPTHPYPTCFIFTYQHAISKATSNQLCTPTCLVKTYLPYPK